ncbi:MAG TPA: SRPBCC domain-containing protein [Myxococcota bacterium]|nr:SRPBCC domain-containing protein [Myxococcota bacterium]
MIRAAASTSGGSEERTPDHDFVLSVEMPASPAAVYDAWVSGDGHAAMTGAGATSEPRVGGRFTAWDGYIEGTWLELKPGRRVVMAWRTSEFGADDAPARVELELDASEGGALLRLTQSGSPAGQGPRYRQGWHDFYFNPMRAWFGR